MVGQHAESDVEPGILSETPACDLLAQFDQRLESVDHEDRRDALLQDRHTLQAHAGVDVLGGQRAELLALIHVVAGEDQVPILDETVAVAARPAAGLATAVLGPAVIVELGAGTAWPAGSHRAPEVVAARETHHAFTRHAHGLPVLNRLDIRLYALITLEVRDPQSVRIELEVVTRELPGELDGALFEIVSHREVAEHLEEGAVPGGQTHLVYVGGAEALLQAGEPATGRLGQPHEIGLELLHARRGEEHRRVFVGHERRAGDQQVVSLDEVVKIHLP